MNAMMNAMMNILVFNIGSSTIKYEVLSGEKKLLKGMIDNVKDYSSSLKKVMKIIEEENIDIDAVGHRVVHGGMIKDSQKITKRLIEIIRKNSKLAPLHNPNNLAGILASLKLFKVPQVAVFDTSFHSTIPPEAFTYAIPVTIADRYNIRRYGFHGISHNYVYIEACKILKKRPNQVNAITCHLGNGCSITAIKRGKSIDTSMGFTPLEGVVMGTRSGSIDPSIISFLVQHGHSAKQVDKMLNNKSGLLALSGRTNDMRKLIRSKDKKSMLTKDIFCYSIMKYIGAYAAVLGNVDVIVFTAGIGENACGIREKILKNLEYMGVKIDKQKNKRNEIVISLRSKVKVLVIPTEEALMIAKETVNVLRKK